MAKLEEAVRAQLMAVVSRAADAAEILRRKLRSNLRVNIRPPQKPWRGGGEVIWIHAEGKRENVGYNAHNRAWILSIARDGYSDILWQRSGRGLSHSSPSWATEEWLKLYRSPREMAGWIVAWHDAEVWCRNRIVGLNRAIEEIERQQASFAQRVRGEAAIDRLSTLE